MAEIARRAGVTRLTVYTRFPDERELFAACSAQFIGAHRPPDPGRWLEIADRGRRLRVALADLHAWFQGGEAMLANSRRDAEVLPALRDVLAESSAEFDAAVRDILGAGLGGGDPKRQRRAQAALGLATDCHAWQRLVRCEQLPADEAIEVLARAVEAAAG